MSNSNFYIVGKHPVIEALKNPNRKVIKLFLNKSRVAFAQIKYIKRMLFEALLNKGTLPLREGFQSGQMGRAVNPLTSVFESSNLSPSTIQ